MDKNGTTIRAVILFGPPGSGKGTQAKLLRQTLGIPHISTGDMLRERMLSDDDLGRTIKEVVNAGELVTNELVNRMVEERVAQNDCERGYILDGYPRTLSQTGTLCARLASRQLGWMAIHLKVDYNEIIRRLAGRRHCAACGAVFHVLYSPPQTSDTCDHCRAGLSVREDDQESVVRRRLEAYEAQTRPLLEFFSGEDCPYHEVPTDGQSPENIARKICQVVRPAAGDSHSAPAEWGYVRRNRR